MRNRISDILQTIIMSLSLVITIMAVIWTLSQMEWIIYFIAYTFLGIIILTIAESCL